MKCSVYNLIIDLGEDDRYLLFNTLSGALIEAEADVAHMLKRHIEPTPTPRLQQTFSENKPIPENAIAGIDEERRGVLSDCGFLVEDQKDEVAEVRELDVTRFAANRDADRGTLSLTILPSIRCNFECFYCFEPLSLRQQDSSMTEEVQDKLCTYVAEKLPLPEIRKLSTTWYGGEPLLYPQIVDSLQRRMNAIADAEGVNVKSSIVTNGFLLSRDNSDMLVENGITTAQVTLDGPAKIHNKRRLYTPDRNANYDTILTNLANANPEMDVIIRVNVGSHNSETIEELVNDLTEARIWPYRRGIGVYLAPVTGGKDSLPRGEYLSLEDDFRLDMVRKFNELTDGPRAKLEFKLPSLTNISQCGHIVDEKHIWVVDRVGDVFRCWDVPGQESHCVGTLDDLIHDRINGLNRWVMNPEIREETGCYKCKMAPVCTVPCPSHYFSEWKSGEYLGKYDDGNPFCCDWKFGIENRLASEYKFYSESPELVYGFPGEGSTENLLQIAD